jgi:hypothetical protein
VTNSTVSGNTANNAGGGIYSCGGTNLVYATVVSNRAPIGANLGCAGADPFVAQTFGSVIALPLGGGTNCGGVILGSSGYNFSDDASCSLSTGTDKQNAGDPKLGALADNGGPTLTRLPLTGARSSTPSPIRLARPAQRRASPPTNEASADQAQPAGHATSAL